MVVSQQTFDPVSFVSPDEILAHPSFRAARDVWIDALLGLYENEPFLNRLLCETTRASVFFQVLTLDAVHDRADRKTWPTIGRLQESMVGYGLSSPRRIEAIVSRLVETGYVARHIVGSDRRVRLLMPTDKMRSHDLDWLRAYYSPLAVMFPGCGYEPAMRREQVFRTVVRRIGHAMPGNAARLLASNPNITLFMNREAGMMVLIKLVQAGGALAPSRLMLTDLAERFGISRTHVRRMLQDGERAGLLRLSDAGIALEPPLAASFDRFVADCMSAFDVMYHLAMNAPEMADSDARRRH